MQECEGKSELVRILPEYSCIAEAHPYMWARSDQIYAEAESNARAGSSASVGTTTKERTSIARHSGICGCSGGDTRSR